MTVITAEETNSFLPKPIAHLYNAITTLCRIVDKTATNVEKVTDLGFGAMEITLDIQRRSLQQRQQAIAQQ
jgi:hypothetical protein